MLLAGKKMPFKLVITFGSSQFRGSTASIKRLFEIFPLLDTPYHSCIPMKPTRSVYLLLGKAIFSSRLCFLMLIFCI